MILSLWGVCHITSFRVLRVRAFSIGVPLPSWVVRETIVPVIILWVSAVGWLVVLGMWVLLVWRRGVVRWEPVIRWIPPIWVIAVGITWMTVRVRTIGGVSSVRVVVPWSPGGVVG